MRAGVVALVGRPNVGKSTLLNRLMGQKLAIVSDRPQTTRNRIRGVVNRPGAQVVLIDTPGIHKPLHRMNERMLRSSLAVLREVDVAAVLTDAGEAFGAGDRFLVDTLAREARTPVFLVVNKIDAVRRREALLPVIDRWSQARSFDEVYPISAKTGDGVEELLAGLVARLPEGEPLFAEGDETDVTERFLAAEVVREQILRTMREEVPYTTTVVIEDFADDEAAGLARIEASVLVERDSQKGILVGRGGAAIKALGTAARLELEALLGRRVYLGLRVKTARDWRDDDRLLDRIGL